MIVPQYWAEGRLRERIQGHQVTLRRFGWSDVSQEAAQQHADERLREALARVVAGDFLVRRATKLPYNGAEGMPIREEIVSRHGEAIITRNAYGALCLNTPDVLFADIDFDEGSIGCFVCSSMIVAILAGVAYGWWFGSALQGVAVAAAITVLGWLASVVLHRLLRFLQGSPAERARRRIDKFVEQHPDWRLRIYRTPAGLRVLAMQRTFDPREPAVTEFFQALGTDPIYQRMCWNQNCFRARVSPKPWRIGLEQRMKPRPGVWPVNPDRLPDRTRWIAAYEQASRGYAACQFVDTIGAHTMHPAAQAIQSLHDNLCQATRGLPIA